MAKDYMIFEPENPYVKFKEQLDYLNALTKEVEEAVKQRDAKVYAFQDELRKVFNPDQTAFNDLHTELKEAIRLKKGNEVLDGLLYKLALIYRKWLPCREYLLELNTDPELRTLFEALDKMVKKIEKEESGKKEASRIESKRTDGNQANVSPKKNRKRDSGTSGRIADQRVRNTKKSSHHEDAKSTHVVC